MSFELQILGSNSSLPSYGRHHTSQYLRIENSNYLIDCGEGTQYQIKRYKISLNKISRIFISHLHGDHYLGLMGILFSMHLSGRKHPLSVYGQKGLDEIILTQLKYSGSTLNYDLKFIHINPEKREVIHENEKIIVESFPLLHRVPCCGFLFREKPHPRKIKAEVLPEGLKHEDFEKLKAGEDLMGPDGKVMYRNSHLTLPPRKSRSYAFCSDTGYLPELKNIVQGVDLLYHETTFLEDKEVWARETQHSSTKDAGLIASSSGVHKLLIGHFSARYKDVTPFVTETKKYFSNTVAAIEGEIYNISE